MFQQGLIGCHFGIIWTVYQTVVPVALRKLLYITFLDKTRNVPNGLLKMCPRLEPQLHCEAACCSGIAISVVAQVSYMSVCKMRPRPKPQHHFEVACCRERANAAVAQFRAYRGSPRRVAQSLGLTFWRLPGAYFEQNRCKTIGKRSV